MSETNTEMPETLTYPFTEDEAHLANAVWHFNCGPAALSVCLNLSLEALRPHLGDFETRRYLNPTAMRECITRAGGRVVGVDQRWPHHGLALIQWGGPWLAAGANPRWRYRATHWTHSRIIDGQTWVFDINGGWQSLAEWEGETVPAITRATPRADGAWSINLGWEVRRE